MFSWRDWPCSKASKHSCDILMGLVTLQIQDMFWQMRLDSSKESGWKSLGTLHTTSWEPALLEANILQSPPRSKHKSDLCDTMTMVTPEVTNVASVFQRSDVDLTQAGQRCLGEHTPQMLSIHPRCWYLGPAYELNATCSSSIAKTSLTNNNITSHASQNSRQNKL